jgi:hypothetical protein
MVENEESSRRQTTKARKIWKAAKERSRALNMRFQNPCKRALDHTFALLDLPTLRPTASIKKSFSGDGHAWGLKSDSSNVFHGLNLRRSVRG